MSDPICKYCGLSCALPPGVDMHGECGCCCQWVKRRLLERLSVLLAALAVRPAQSCRVEP